MLPTIGFSDNRIKVSVDVERVRVDGSYKGRFTLRLTLLIAFPLILKSDNMAVGRFSDVGRGVVRVRLS